VSYAVEPAWRRAMRRGLRTAVICWPGITPDQEQQRAHYVITYGEAAVPAARHVISLTRTSPWPGVPPSYSIHLTGALVEPSTGTMLGRVLAVDSVNESMIASRGTTAFTLPEPRSSMSIRSPPRRMNGRLGATLTVRDMAGDGC